MGWKMKRFFLTSAIAVCLLQGQGAGELPMEALFQEQSTLAGKVETQAIEESQGKIQAKIQETESLKDLEESLRGKILDLYRQALTRLETAKTFKTSAEGYKKSIETAPAEVKQLRRELEELAAQPPGKVPLEYPSGATAKELEALLAKEQAEQASIRNSLADLEAKVKAQKERPARARVELSEAQMKLEEIEKDLKVPPPADENPLLTEARRVFLEARKVSRTNEIIMLEQELLSNEARGELLTLSRDRAARLAARADDRVNHLQEKTSALRREEAEKAKKEADRALREAIGKHPAVRELAEENLTLSEEREVVVSKREDAEGNRKDIQKQLEEIEKDFKNATERVEIAGLSSALGGVLQEQRNKLPEVRLYQRNAAKRQTQILTARLERMKIEEMQKDLSVPDEKVAQIMEAVDRSLPLEQREEIEKEVKKLILAKRETLLHLDDAYYKYISELGYLESKEKQLVNKSQDFASFLDERLLWIPNAPPLGWRTHENLPPAVLWFCDPRMWTEAGGVVVTEIAGFPVWKLLALLAFFMLFYARRALRRGLKKIEEKVGEIHEDSFLLTVQAMVVTLLLAAPWPLLAWTLAWFLGEPVDAPDFAKAVSAGLAVTAAFFLAIQFLRLICSESGLARIHFRWPERSLALVHRNLLWFMIILLPTQFIVSVVEWQAQDAYQESLGRLAFIAEMGALALVTLRLFRPQGGIFEPLFSSSSKGWVFRLRYFLYLAVSGIPMTLAVLAAMGYYYTALRLSNRLFASISLFLGTTIVYGLLQRWLFVTRRKLAVAKARERRRAIAAEEEEKGRSGSGGEEASIVQEIPEMNLATISGQTRELLKAILVLSVFLGLWLIWSDVLPALKIFEGVTLWHYTVVVDGGEQLRPITLAALALAIVVGLITAVGARNVPGVLEIGILQHLPLDAGSRYAIATISRYLIIMVGVIVGFGIIGVSWSHVQWLIAALGIGLGFGLQEIFANFVCGLIILFERPIRLGDTVTVGDIHGTVSRIRIRATTITDWDRKELIVPNKRFVTEQLVNWSLTDPITRLVIDVGIAYGSDTELAHKVMLETIKAHPLVLEDPKPGVFFLGFGESSLNFSVRVFIREPAQRFSISHDLHMNLDKALRKHGIVIAFPQRDIHMRMIEPPEKPEKSAPEKERS